MRGNILYPLSQLKDVYPDLYELEITKYNDREFVMDQTIDMLECTWKDVLHISPVHPQQYKDAFSENGIERIFEAFAIPIEMLDPSLTVVFPHDTATTQRKSFTPFIAKDIEKFSNLPDRTKVYYSESLERGERPLLNLYVPHVLYKGTIDTKFLEIIRV